MQSTRLKELVTQAQQELQAALIAGQDTTDARQRLKLASEEHNRVTALEASQCDDERKAESTVLTDYVADLHQQEVSDVGTAVAALLHGLAVPEITLPVHGLHALVRARTAHEAATEEVANHAEHVQGLEERRNALLEEQQQIIQRRAAGNRDDEADGRRLALIDADLTGLAGIIDNARSMAPQNHASTLAELQRLEQRWAQEKAEALASALNVLVYQFEERLIATATALRKLTPVGGIGQRYRMDLRLAQVAHTRLF